jgi:lipoprotein signal peptidase
MPRARSRGSPSPPSSVLEVHYTARWRHPLAQIGLGAALGGALGNAWDRFSRPGIIDFIAIGPWPVFHLADVAIMLGVALALWFGWV